MFDYSDVEMQEDFPASGSKPKHFRDPFRKANSVAHGESARVPTSYKATDESSAGAFGLRANGPGINPNGKIFNFPLPDEHISISRCKINPFLQMKSQSQKDENSGNEAIRIGEDHPDSFFKSIRIAVRAAQCFSLLPVTGYEGPNYKRLKFRWIHWKTIYSASVLCGVSLLFVSSVTQSLKHGITYDKTGEFAFFGYGLVANLLLLNLSRKWKQMCEDFAKMEVKLNKYNYPIGIARNFQVVTFLFITVALVEHILEKTRKFILILPCTQDRRVLSIVEYFLNHYFHEVFAFTTFTLWKGLILLVINFLCAFTWSFTDLILAFISWTIYKRFKMFNEALFKIHGQDKDRNFWKTTREDYNELTELTRKVDSQIQKLILLSLGDNFYFICIQLLKSLKKTTNLYESAYFLWSISFLIGRTCFVAFAAAGINDESKEAKTVLYSVPERSYHAETRRFLTQLSTNDVALTGYRFFSITRSLILTIAGTVVTYEVILVQFSTGGDDWEAMINKTYCIHMEY